MKYKFLAPLAGFLLISSVAMSAPILDQTSGAVETNPNFRACNFPCEWQQTVTAGVTGLLTGVKLYGEGTERVRINAGSPWQTGPWAIDTTINLTSEGALLDLSAYGFQAIAEQTFIIDILESTNLIIPSLIAYNRGVLYLDNASNAHAFPFTGYSIAFETYVEPAATAVPEPASLLLLGLGLAGMAAVRQRGRSPL